MTIMRKLRQLQDELETLPKSNPELIQQAEQYKKDYLEESIELILAELSRAD